MKLKLFFVLAVFLVLVGTVYASEIDAESSSHVSGEFAGNIESGYDENLIMPTRKLC